MPPSTESLRIVVSKLIDLYISETLCSVYQKGPFLVHGCSRLLRKLKVTTLARGCEEKVGRINGAAFSEADPSRCKLVLCSHHAHRLAQPPTNL